MPVAAARKTPPALHSQLGIRTGEQLHLVPVLGVGGLLGVLDRHRPGLGSQEGGQEGSGIGGLAQGLRNTPGGAGGVAIVVEIEVAHRDAGKALEREDGTGGQGGGAAAKACATAVSGRTMDVQAGKPMDTAGTRVRDRRIEIRATAEDRQLIDRAVAASGTDLTGFAITHLRLAAQQVLANREEFRLEPEALEAWERINQRPARSLKGLRALMDRPSPFQE